MPLEKQKAYFDMSFLNDFSFFFNFSRKNNKLILTVYKSKKENKTKSQLKRIIVSLAAIYKLKLPLKATNITLQT